MYATHTYLYMAGHTVHPQEPVASSSSRLAEQDGGLLVGTCVYIYRGWIPPAVGLRHTVCPVAAPESPVSPVASTWGCSPTPAAGTSTRTHSSHWHYGHRDPHDPQSHSSCWCLGLLTLVSPVAAPRTHRTSRPWSGSSCCTQTLLHPQNRVPHTGKDVERDLKRRYGRLHRAWPDWHTDWPTIYMRPALFRPLSLCFPILTPLQIT